MLYPYFNGDGGTWYSSQSSMYISESRKSFIFLYLRMEKVSLKKQYTKENHNVLMIIFIVERRIVN